MEKSINVQMALLDVQSQLLMIDEMLTAKEADLDKEYWGMRVTLRDIEAKINRIIETDCAVNIVIPEKEAGGAQ